jgi:para-nitrobenzyl esterase
MPLVLNRRAWLWLAALVVIGCGGLQRPEQSDAEAASLEDPVRIAAGPITGETKDGVHIYRGIPFAEPPVGELRWKPPVALKAKWDKPRAMTKFGPACPQPGYLGVAEKDMSEDCLHLNVWTPATQVDAKLPVMVWIHGGAFFLGASSQGVYDGLELAKKGVVVVTINYRLGVFGFLAHPALTKESPHKASGNYGLFDQLFALRWVQDNIARFGGDPGNVTVFGQSAGGICVNFLMILPKSKGLFQRAIVQSGGYADLPSGIIRRRDRDHKGHDCLERLGTAFAKRLGVAEEDAVLKAMRAKPWREVLKAFPIDVRIADLKPTQFLGVDGYLIPDDWKTRREAKQPRVPLLLGTVADEGGSFALLAGDADHIRATFKRVCGEHCDQALKLYPVDTRAAAKEAIAAFLGDVFVAGTRQLARRHVKDQPKTYLYQFTRIPPPYAKVGKGATHACELGYVFHVLPEGMGLEEGDDKLSKAIMDYWVSFARTGDPNHKGAPTWPAYDADKDVYLRLDTTIKPATHLRKKYCDFFDELMQEKPKE